LGLESAGVTDREPDLALVSSPARVADSIESLQRGELICVDRRGRVVSRRSARRRQALAWGGGLLLIGAAFSLGTGFGVGAVIGAGVGAGISGLSQQRWRGALERISRLAEANHLDEALAEIEAFRRRRLPSRVRPILETLEGRVRWWAGTPEDGIACLESAIRGFESTRGGTDQFWYWIARYQRVAALARLGRIDEAMAARSGEAECPDGEMSRLHRCNADLILAFYGDRDDVIPADEVLHELGTLSLRSNVLGGLLVAIAWALDRRGDAELASHFIAESRSRLDEPRLRRATPELHAWMERRLAQLPADPDAPD
jgi:hypothetical protein